MLRQTTPSAAPEATVYCPFRAPARSPFPGSEGRGERERFDQQRGLSLTRARLPAPQAEGAAESAEWPCATGFQAGFVCEGGLLFQGESDGDWRRFEPGHCFCLWPGATGLRFRWEGASAFFWLDMRAEDGWAFQNSENDGLIQKTIAGGPASNQAALLGAQLFRLDSNQSRERLRIAAKSLEWLSIALDPSLFEPQATGSERRSRREDAALETAARHLERNLEQRHSIAQLSRVAHLNEFKLKQGFRRRYGTTVFGYLRQKRMERARELLIDDGVSVIEAATTVGYSNASHFAKAFRDVYGCNPKRLAQANGLSAPPKLAGHSTAATARPTLES